MWDLLIGLVVGVGAGYIGQPLIKKLIDRLLGRL